MPQLVSVGRLMGRAKASAAPTFASIIAAKAIAAWSTGRLINPNYGGSIADFAAGVCSKIYDQIGTNHATGVASPTQGTGTINGLNYVKLNGTTQYFSLASQINLTTTDCEQWVAYGKITASVTNDPIGLGLSSGTCGIRYNGSANYDLRSTSAGPTAYNIQYAMVPGINIDRIKRASGTVYVDTNGEQMGNVYGKALAGNFSFNQIGRSSTTVFSKSGVCEVILFSSALTDAEAAIVQANMNAAWRSGLYVKSAGDDTALGWNDDTAWQTASAVKTLIHRQGSTVYFNKGDTWAEQLKFSTTNQQGIATDYVNMTSYGTGALPIFDGGTTVSGAGMTALLGTEYIVTVALTSVQCVWAISSLLPANYIGDKILRLEQGTAGSLTWTAGVGSPGDTNYSPPVGQWAYALGVLHVNVGQDPTTMSFKAAQETGTQTSGFDCGKSYIKTTGLQFQYWPYDGGTFGVSTTGGAMANSVTKYNANDGIGGNGTATVITGGQTAYNGQARVSSGPAGDGISAHGGSITIDGLQVLFNDKAGVDHQDNTTATHRNILSRGNNRNIYVASISGTATMTWTNVVVVREANDGVNAVEFDVGASHLARFLTVVNYGVSGSGKGIVINQTGTTLLQDCITDGFGTGLTLTASGGLTHDHNDHHDTTPYSGTTAGTGDITSDPLFTSRATADFTLQSPASPCIGAGMAIAGVTTDYTGATRANPPSIGAYEA